MEAGEAEQGSQHANGEDMESNDEGSDDSTRSRRTVVKDSGSMPKKKRKAAKKREASILVESEVRAILALVRRLLGMSGDALLVCVLGTPS